jgi:NADPH-dependent glutamate synthase beta subunit-like oxidoreductase
MSLAHESRIARRMIKQRRAEIAKREAKPIEFTRADPAELAKFDPATKLCQMNCGAHRDDPRSFKEIKLLCGDCLDATQ